MPRPKKCRFVGFEPNIKIFKPSGIPIIDLDCIKLSIDELESIRLADMLGNSHESAAREMQISRATLGRILESGRKKVADALINGKVILIEAGDFCNYEHIQNQVKCEFCKRKNF